VTAKDRANTCGVLNWIIKKLKKMEKTSSALGRDLLPLTEYFVEELRDVYGAEKQIAVALPKLRKAATSPDLAMAFEDHLKVTQTQISRLEQIFEVLGKDAEAKKCEGMEGLLKEGETVIHDTEAGSATRDVGLIIAAQKVEHYEIAAYGSLRQLAKSIDKPEIFQLLEETLAEEKGTDMLLSNLAETLINKDASMEIR
jgi:ferritin-like metal-binding protein YciE